MSCPSAQPLTQNSAARRYTLGGVFLARYSDSPVGAFDEVRAWPALASSRQALQRLTRACRTQLVALAGLVWQFPTSCAWAARVYVSSADARSHGRKVCGLPSSHARFQAQGLAAGEKGSWWQAGGAGGVHPGTPEQQRLAAAPGGSELDGAPALGSVAVTALARRGGWRRAWREGEAGARVCSLALPPARQGGGGRGPRLRLSLPSLSGATPEHPGLLRYACQLAARVRLSPCAGVEVRTSGYPPFRDSCFLTCTN